MLVAGLGETMRPFFVREVAEALEMDPAHFSHPQLFLAEIHLRRGDKQSAVADLESFLKHHPDWPQAAVMREKIAGWKK